MSVNRFVTPGFVLSIDLLMVSVVNWLYWLIISKITTPNEVGQATSVYSFAVLASAITLLGFEYTLVKRGSQEPLHILGTVVILESFIIVAAFPFLFFFVDNLYHGSLSELTWIAIGIVVFSSQRHIMRYALLGISDARSVLIINLVGVSLQLAVGFALVTLEFGATGILASFLVNMIFVTIASAMITKKSFSFCYGGLSYVKATLKDALVNTPAPLAKTSIYSLSVVLLALVGVNQDDIGTFYIALMLSVVTGGFAANMALMVIPASLRSKRDLSADSVRIGISLTAPLIVILMTSPESILSLIGQAYASSATILVVLAAAIIPHTIVANSISKFNNLGSPKKIVAIGCIHVSTFLSIFYLIVPDYGTLGAAISILFSSIFAALIAMVWLEKDLLRSLLRCLLSIVGGLLTGYTIQFLAVQNPLVIASCSVGVTLILIFLLKNTTKAEVTLIIRGLFRQA
jgi:O-antigen/teichoic acid export membrane protein